MIDWVKRYWGNIIISGIVLVLFFIYSVSRIKKDDPLDFINCLIFWVLYLTFIVAYAQLVEYKKERKKDTTLGLIKFIQEEEYREARGYLIKALGNKPYKYWTDNDRAIAEKVIANYDYVGLYYREGYIDKNLLIKNWFFSIIACWKAAENMIQEKRKEYKHSYHPDFEDLYYEALAFYYENKFLCKLYGLVEIEGKDMHDFVGKDMLSDEYRPKNFKKIHVDILTKKIFQRLKERKMVGSQCPSQYYLTHKGMKEAQKLRDFKKCDEKRYLYEYEVV